MVIIGRITKNAVVNQLKDERQVVNFSVALNDYYKPKNGEAKQFTTYVNCSYWISTKIAERLTKGGLVELDGRLFVNAYTGMNGEAKASLNCHVNNIKIHGHSKETVQVNQPVAASNEQAEPTDDFPF